MKSRTFVSQGKKVNFPVFFPDATKAVVRTIDSNDIRKTKTEGLLINTLHLMLRPGGKVLKKAGGIRKFMSWDGGLISDSGGFQVGSLIKRNPKLGKVTDEGAVFKLPGSEKIILTPEVSMKFQMDLGTDMVVVLDDFDSPDASLNDLKKSVNRTIDWAKRAKKEYLKICQKKRLKKRPYILGVVQGGKNKALRKYCTEELLKIGFDGLGYGGEEKIGGINVNYDLAKYLRSLVPEDILLYALGVGKPEDIIALSKIGYDIFDCVLPTRDARHKRLYVYNSTSINKINVFSKEIYSYYVPDRSIYESDFRCISSACDCVLCKNYSRAYLYHLFKISDTSALRLATIHNLRFYSILMEKLKQSLGSK